MTDRWVNFDIEVTVASEDVEVTASNAEKGDAMEKVLDALVDALESSGFQAKYEPVLSVAWEDVGDGPATAETPDLSEVSNRPAGVRTRPTGAPLGESTLADANGNPIKLYFSERQTLELARSFAKTREGTVPQVLGQGLVDILERVGRERLAT